MFGRRLFAPGDPVVKLAVRQLDQFLIEVEFFRRQLVQLRIGEMAEDEVHFLHAAVPGAEFEPPAADFKVLRCGCAHGALLSVHRVDIDR